MAAPTTTLHAALAALTDGVSALEAIERFAPEVVFLDIGLPGMNGYEVACRMRALPGGDDLLRYALTGRGEEGDRRRARDAGFDAHVAKPVSLATLAELLSAQSRARA